MRVVIVRFTASFRSCFRTFGAKVLGIFVLMERQFNMNESSWNVAPEERKFHRSECSTERKFHGSESSLCRLFAAVNESAEERKGLDS